MQCGYEWGLKTILHDSCIQRKAGTDKRKLNKVSLIWSSEAFIQKVKGHYRDRNGLICFKEQDTQVSLRPILCSSVNIL